MKSARTPANRARHAIEGEIVGISLDGHADDVPGVAQGQAGQEREIDCHQGEAGQSGQRQDDKTPTDATNARQDIAGNAELYRPSRRG